MREGKKKLLILFDFDNESSSSSLSLSIFGYIIYGYNLYVHVRSFVGINKNFIKKSFDYFLSLSYAFAFVICFFFTFEISNNPTALFSKRFETLFSLKIVTFKIQLIFQCLKRFELLIMYSMSFYDRPTFPPIQLT